MTFNEAVQHTLREEKGYQCRKTDPGNWTGGAIGKGDLKGTKFGISAASYPKLDIKNLTVEQAREIYRTDFWDRAGCPFAPADLRLPLFDAAVNCGVGTAVRWAQLLAGTIPDGVVGPMTRAAWEAADIPRLVENFMWLRLHLHAELAMRRPYQLKELPGWVIRCFNIRTIARHEA